MFFQVHFRKQFPGIIHHGRHAYFLYRPLVGYEVGIVADEEHRGGLFIHGEESGDVVAPRFIERSKIIQCQVFVPYFKIDDLPEGSGFESECEEKSEEVLFVLTDEKGV